MDHEQWLQQHDRMIADMDHMLRRAIRDSIREGRNERLRRKRALAEIDGKITQLAAAQLVTEEKLQRLIEERRQGGNGNR